MVFISIGNRPLLLNETVNRRAGIVELKQQLVTLPLKKLEPALRHHQESLPATSLRHVDVLVTMESVLFEKLSFTGAYAEECIVLIGGPECFG